MKTIPALEAAAVVALSFAAVVAVGWRWGAHGPAGTTLAELLLVVAPVLVYVRARRIDAATLGLAEFPVAATAGALVAGAAAFYLLAVALQLWLERVWPTPLEVREAMRRVVIPAHGARPLAIDLLALALVPAVAEELLFRGLLFGATRPRLGATGAVIVTAIAFGLYHGSIYRFAPATLGGLLLGVVRAASGSLWPAIAFHVANNAGVIVALRLGYDAPPPSPLPLAVAFAAFVGGAALMLRGRAALQRP